MPDALEIRRLSGADAAAYRTVRLEALRGHPDAFRSSFEDDEPLPLDYWVAHLDGQFVLGGGRVGQALGAMAGLAIDARSKTRHRGYLVSVFVTPDLRGTGLAAGLVAGVIAEARRDLEELLLVVSAHNAAAITLYRRLGFEDRWTETRSLKFSETYADEMTMSLRF